jgi:hypothetical protein
MGVLHHLPMPPAETLPIRLAMLCGASSLVARIENDLRSPVVFLIQVSNGIDPVSINRALRALQIAFGESSRSGDATLLYTYDHNGAAVRDATLARLTEIRGMCRGGGTEFAKAVKMFDADMRARFDTEFDHPDYRPIVIHLTTGMYAMDPEADAILLRYRVFSLLVLGIEAQRNQPMSFGETVQFDFFPRS